MNEQVGRDLVSPLGRDARQRSRDDATDVPREGDVRIGIVDPLDDLLARAGGGRRLEIARQLLGDDVLVDTERQRSHWSTHPP